MYILPSFYFRHNAAGVNNKAAPHDEGLLLALPGGKLQLRQAGLLAI